MRVRGPEAGTHDIGDVMTEKIEGQQAGRYCKACGTPAEGATLCEHCGAVLDLPDRGGLIEDKGAAVRRDFERENRENRQRRQS
jgi:hypothetical protein